MTAEFHLYLPQMRMSHDTIVQRALAAEANGFDGIAFMDHLVPPLADDQDMWEAITTAAWVLARTTTLTVGHLVLCDAFRHPAVLARQVTSLAHASEGRFELGLGWGSVPAELDTFGVGEVGAGSRVRRMGETLTILRALWTGESVDFEGEFFSIKGGRQCPPPQTSIPITIGGVGPKTMALVREHADWWNVPIHSLHQLDETRPLAGTAKVSTQQMVAVVDDDQDRAEWQARIQRRYAGTKMLDQVVVGTPTELGEFFDERHQQGIDRFYVWFADFAPPSTLRHFAEVIGAVG